MEQKFCQSCAMPMENEQYGTEADGSLSADYCSYCYADGKFQGDMTMEEMVGFCAKPMAEHNPGMTEEAAREAMMKFFPTLKRWKA